MASKNILHLIKTISTALEPCCKDMLNAEQEAWWLLEKLTGKSKTALILHAQINLSDSEQAQLQEWITDRVKNKKPLSYIMGSVPFCNLEILVKPPVLIPRPETEEWVSWLIDLMQKENLSNLTILDLCCGSGCIGLALAKAFPKATVLGLDINPQAIKLSQENKMLNKIENIEFIQSDLYNELPTNFTCNLIVSNPPYLAKQELEALSDEVKSWEDHAALVAEQQGMDFYHIIFKNARQYLHPMARSIPNVVVEIGPAQNSIENIFHLYGIEKFIICNDMQHKRRWVGCWI